MKKFVVVAAAFAVGTSALAAEPGVFYGSFGGGLYELETQGFDETAATMKLVGGYGLSRNVALEASYSRLFEASSVVDDVKVDIDGNVWDLSSKFLFPITDRIHPYGRLGWSYIDLNALASADGESERFNHYEDAFNWAIGTGITLNRKLTINGEYGRTMIDEGDLDSASISLTYWFGVR